MSDPLDELRARWRALDPPPADAEPDARTRATVAWMRAAWSPLEAPVADVPRPVAQRAVWPFALAGALAAAGVVLWLTWRPAVDTTNGPEVAVREQGAPTTPETAHAPGLPITPEETPARFLADGSVELRRGSVTLILFDPPNEDPQ